MNRITQKHKKRISKKTKKYYGGKPGQISKQNKPLNVVNKPKNDTNDTTDQNNAKDINDTKDTNNSTLHEISKEGVYGMVTDKVTDFAINTTDYLKTKALRLVGLQPVNSTNNNSQPNETYNNVSNITTKASNIISNVSNDVVSIANHGASAIIQNVNDVLKTPQVNQSVTQAGKDTTEIAKKLLDTFNQNANNPEFKQEFMTAANNLADYATITVKAIDKPLNESIDMTNKAGVKAASGLASGAVKVIGDSVAAVPYIGAIVDVGKAVNDGTKAIGSTIEAGTEVAQTAASFVTKASDNLNKGLRELEEKKKQGEEIMNRTTDSIHQFQNNAKILGDSYSNNIDTDTDKDTSINKNGGTKKNIQKQKRISKKVRFSNKRTKHT
jgi:hypothetical protein